MKKQIVFKKRSIRIERIQTLIFCVFQKRTGNNVSEQLFCRDEVTRTPDLHVPNVARYQLCYIPIFSRCKVKYF